MERTPDEWATLRAVRALSHSISTTYTAYKVGVEDRPTTRPSEFAGTPVELPACKFHRTEAECNCFAIVESVYRMKNFIFPSERAGPLIVLRDAMIDAVLSENIVYVGNDLRAAGFVCRGGPCPPVIPLYGQPVMPRV